VFELAQVNLARPRAPLDAPLLAEFMAALDPVNARADQAPGFVWRLQDDAGNATGVPVFGDDALIVNLSVWESPEALRDWVYRDPEHLAVMRRRREWFARMETFLCLWWVPAGHRPPVAEAEERLVHLRAHGPSQHAFTFRALFPQPGLPPVAVRDDRDLCPA
jgi:heme-degrading monooxygenase HmoA